MLQFSASRIRKVRVVRSAVIPFIAQLHAVSNTYAEHSKGIEMHKARWF